MRVGVDTMNFGAEVTGIGRIVSELIEMLAREGLEVTCADWDSPIPTFPVTGGLRLESYTIGCPVFHVAQALRRHFGQCVSLSCNRQRFLRSPAHFLKFQSSSMHKTCHWRPRLKAQSHPSGPSWLLWMASWVERQMLWRAVSTVTISQARAQPLVQKGGKAGGVTVVRKCIPAGYRGSKRVGSQLPKSVWTGRVGLDESQL